MLINGPLLPPDRTVTPLTNGRCELLYNLMVIYSSSHANTVFEALANATRMAIVELLARGERSVLDLAGQFEISQPAVTKHLNILERAGLIERRKRGRFRYCRLAPEALEPAFDWIQRTRAYWEERFRVLDEYLEEISEDEEEKV